MRAASYTHGGMDWAMLFARYDRDHSGGLDFKEFTTALRRDGSVGHNIAATELQQVFDFIDTDRDGLIELEELEVFLDSELSELLHKPLALGLCLVRADSDASGLPSGIVAAGAAPARGLRLLRLLFL